MEINDITDAIIGRAIFIHQELGPGLLESAYQRILVYELRKLGFEVEAEKEIPLTWDGNVLGESFRADLIVNGSVLVELKSTETQNPVFWKQTKTYTVVADLKLGLLINFGLPTLVDGISRVANGELE
jgi:GxxExxY protein